MRLLPRIAATGSGKWIRNAWPCLRFESAVRGRRAGALRYVVVDRLFLRDSMTVRYR